MVPIKFHRQCQDDRDLWPGSSRIYEQLVCEFKKSDLAKIVELCMVQKRFQDRVPKITLTFDPMTQSTFFLLS